MWTWLSFDSPQYCEWCTWCIYPDDDEQVLFAYGHYFCSEDCAENYANEEYRIDY